MKFSTTVTYAFGLLVPLVPSLVSAADCYSESGCQQCESGDSLRSFASSFCNNDGGNTMQLQSWGWASAISAGGDFSSSSSCQDAFNNIIDQCYGNRDGGWYTLESVLSVAFCNCESAMNP